MRDKAPLALMEQAVMILVFAVAAAVCVRAFAYCAATSRRLEQSGAAMTAASTVADAVRSGDIQVLSGMGIPFRPGLDTEPSELSVTNPLPCPMYVEIRYAQPSLYLWSAEVIVTDQSGNELARLPVSGQLERS